MKKLYETPEMEVFNFETTDTIMDTEICPGDTASCPGDTGVCPMHTGGCELECLMDGGSECIIHNANCPSDCILDGICVTDVNISQK